MESAMQKIPKRVYTLEFKEQAVKLAQSGRSIASVAGHPRRDRWRLRQSAEGAGAARPWPERE
ncbi:hypothetical protein AY586_10595 [Marichromatium gracile]|uniref:Transposase n=1 Tax=Marichromatium gracile TaxID=1048 RepID=A0ABR5VHG6_MARGR|nr:hypothetical protein AY586_10595 [Marichromatium gracile]